MSDDAEKVTEDEAPTNDRREQRVRRRWLGVGVVFRLTLAALLIFVAGLALTGRSVPVPYWAEERISTSFNDRLTGEAVTLGEIEMLIEDGAPVARFRDVSIGNPGGGAVAFLNEVKARVSLGELLRGRLSPERIQLNGAQVTIRRAANGDFSIVTSAAAEAETQSLPDLLGTLDGFLASDALRSIREVSATAVILTVEDARSGRIWQATNANLNVRRDNDGLTMFLASDVFNGTDEVAEVQISFGFDHTSKDTSVDIQVAEMPAADIAIQSPVLAWLSLLDAPLSGAVQAEFDGVEGLTSLAGSLDIEAGSLNPVEGSEPLMFEVATAAFTYDPDRQRLDFTELSVASERLTADATGHTYLSEIDGGWPGAYVGQLIVSEAQFTDTSFFEAPVQMEDVRTDLRLRLDPFSVELAQIAVSDGIGGTIYGSGNIEARKEGWSVAIDLEADVISPEKVFEFWPVTESLLTRTWLKRNVLQGRLTDVFGAFRLLPGSKPDFGLSFEFEDGVVRFMDHMPHITGGAGRGSLGNKAFGFVMTEGVIEAAEGGRLDGAGSVLTVRDVRLKPALGEFEIRAHGPLQAAFSVLNNRPINLLERAGRPIDFARANADISVDLAVPLKRKVARAEVAYDVKARLGNVSSDQVVPGRSVTARELRLTANSEAIRISGPMALDGVPMNADWRQDVSVPNGDAQITGTVALSQDTLVAFGVSLPDGMVSGRGEGRFDVALPAEGTPQLSVQSDLVGLGLRVDALDWLKSASEVGGLELDVSLGETPELESMAFSAPGLAFDGQVQINEGGGLGDAVFDRVRVGNWLDASVRLTPRGEGLTPAISIEGGQFDLREYPRGQGAGAGGRDRAPIDINLETMIVSDDIVLAPFVGQIDAGQAGLSGAFEARLKGQTLVRGTLATTNAGTGVRLQSADAGGVLRDAGVTENARGGTMDIVLTPVVGTPSGNYDGQFLIEDIRLQEAPAMAALLDALSVVGLLNQLSGPGILFDVVDGNFRLTPDTLVLRDAAAVGVSMGISAEGIYGLESKQMDIAGVISPVYFVNAIGRVISRRGEGLFGFNYRMTGPASAPVVSVNPLSVLTPGFLRDIFRRRSPVE